MIEAQSRAFLMTSWHTRTAEQVLAELQTGTQGLDLADAQARLQHNGPNLLPRIPPTPVHQIFLRQFRRVVVLLLAGAAAVAFATGDTADGFAICAVLAINVALGFVVEMRARRAVEALSRLEARRATVIRGGVAREIDAREVVAGDVLAVGSRRGHLPRMHD
jgi:Ca2+-transporting ATPase